MLRIGGWRGQPDGDGGHSELRSRGVLYGLLAARVTKRDVSSNCCSLTIGGGRQRRVGIVAVPVRGRVESILNVIHEVEHGELSHVIASCITVLRREGTSRSVDEAYKSSLRASCKDDMALILSILRSTSTLSSEVLRQTNVHAFVLRVHGSEQGDQATRQCSDRAWPGCHSLSASNNNCRVVAFTSRVLDASRSPRQACTAVARKTIQSRRF